MALIRTLKIAVLAALIAIAATGSGCGSDGPETTDTNHTRTGTVKGSVTLPDVTERKGKKSH